MKSRVRIYRDEIDGKTWEEIEKVLRRKVQCMINEIKGNIKRYRRSSMSKVSKAVLVVILATVCGCAGLEEVTTQPLESVPAEVTINRTSVPTRESIKAETLSKHPNITPTIMVDGVEVDRAYSTLDCDLQDSKLRMHCKQGPVAGGPADCWCEEVN